MASAGTLLLEPVVGWPREMTPGRPYLVTVDLRLAEAAGDWPYDTEELSFTCVLEGPAAFTVEAVHDASVVLHRFGGSYGPAEFIVTPHAEPGSRSLWLTILTERGVDVRRIELPVDVGDDPGDARPTTTRPVRTAVPAQRPAPPASRAVTRLIVDVEPVAHGPGDRYLLRVLKIRPDGAFAGSAVDRSGPVSVDELAVRSGFALAQLADDPHDHDLWVEFVLPDELLGLPVDQWPLERSGSAPVPVGAVLPVVVRGRSAALNLGQRARWQRRSRILRSQENRGEQGRIFWVPREMPDARSLYASLLQADYVCAVFERDPYPGLHALRSAGVPAAVWCRTPRFAEEFAARLASLLPGEPVSELPYLVLRLRQEAASVAAPDRHLGSHITLLWDDTDHEPSVAEPPAEPEEDSESAEAAASTPEADAPVRRLCLLVDVAAFVSRTDIKRAMWTVVARMCEAAGIERETYETQASGNGLLLVLPPGLDEAEVLPELISGLRDGLQEVNRDVAGEGPARVRLRVALAAGVVGTGPNGRLGTALLTVARLLDSPESQAALADRPESDFAVIVAEGLDPDDFGSWASLLEPVDVSTEHGSASGWLLVPGPGRLLTLTVVDLEGRRHELTGPLAMMRVFEIAEHVAAASSDFEGPDDLTHIDIERVDEGGRRRRLDRLETLHDAGLRDGDELRLVSRKSGVDRRDDDPAALENLLATPGTHLIVDGENVAWQGLPFDTDRRDRLVVDRRNWLVSGLGEIAVRTGAEITCVFETVVLRESLPSPSPRGVRVLLPGEEGALGLIGRLAQAEIDRPVVVVSSDRELTDRVQQAGAHLVPADSLLRVLTSPPRRDAAPAGRCAIFACEIVSFARFQRDIQEYLSAVLHENLRRCFDASGVPLDNCHVEDRGDGVIIVPPSGTDPAILVHLLVDRLSGELRRHNAMASEFAKIRLRASMHIGEVVVDAHGIVGTAVNHTFRLLYAQRFKEMFNASHAIVGLIVSAEMYETVIRDGEGLEPGEYTPIEVMVKETSTTAWVRNLPSDSSM
ncbi:NYN domain-containing protein [Actinomadura alba]|uniref:NYN domain-containing protein n=1 Tax=Actinomadura alba TaxID=406431 RepID=A0ABR7LTY8_9ACTN|nr:NYN domain-containing protein [Actinomadura alba]MBC6468249.1 NYN domain-containing protein [Actinomadura alba]